MSKNYIEKATNLERATVEYVPKEMFDELLSRYEEEQTNWLESARGGSELDICMAELVYEVESLREKAEEDMIRVGLDYDE